MKKKKDDSYVFRRSSECACVRANVKCCFLFIFFNCIYYLCKKEKKKLDGEADAKFPTRFDLIRSPERRIASFLFGDRIQRERERKNVGRSTREVRYSSSVEFTNLRVGEK